MSVLRSLTIGSYLSVSSSSFNLGDGRVVTSRRLILPGRRRRETLTYMSRNESTNGSGLQTGVWIDGRNR